MLSFFKDLFDNEPGSDKNSSYPGYNRVEIATCALFLEAAKSDFEFSDKEHEAVTEIVKNLFDLSDEQVQELVNISEERSEKSVSLYDITDILNKNLTDDEKFELMKNLWKILLADEKLSGYEEQMARLVNNNLNLSHKDFIASKIIVKKELGIND